MDKRQLINALIEKISASKTKLEKNLESIQLAINEAPGPSTSHSDTTRFQMSRVENEVAEALRHKERCVASLGRFLFSLSGGKHTVIVLGSLVEIEDFSGSREHYIILPEGGGEEIHDGDRKIMVLTERAPLAQSLIGCMKDEIVYVSVNRNTRGVTIVDVE